MLNNSMARIVLVIHATPARTSKIHMKRNERGESQPLLQTAEYTSVIHV